VREAGGACRERRAHAAGAAGAERGGNGRGTCPV
jgi:hypothetical protein